MFKNIEANLSDRDQQLSALQRLHLMHRNISKAKAKGNAFFTMFLPLVLGLVSGVVAFLIIVAILSSFHSLPSSFRIFLPLLTFVGTLFIMALLSQRIAKRQSAILVSKAEALLHSAAEEIQQQLPVWTEGMGGVAALLNSRQVADALEDKGMRKKEWYELHPALILVPAVLGWLTMLTLPLAGLPLILCGLVYGIKAFNLSKNKNLYGRGWATTAIIVSGVGLVIIIIYFVAKASMI